MVKSMDGGAARKETLAFAGAKKVSPMRVGVDNDFDLFVPSTSFRATVDSSEMAIFKKMTDHGYKGYQIDEALRNFARYLAGEKGKIGRKDIEAVPNIPTLDQIPLNEIEIGRQAIANGKVAVIKLAGGLGTSMKLDRSKLLIKVLGEEDTFIHIINNQVRSLRKIYNCVLPVLLMTSHHTEDDLSKEIIFRNKNDIPTTFLQGEAPRLVASSNMPLECADKKAEMYPPGHGSIYSELYRSGLLQKLYDSGVETIFLSNGDNLGATLDPAIIGHFVASHAPFMSETTPTTLADTKGGYICQDHSGRLMTCETAQLEDPNIDFTSDDSPYKHFHINNLYVNVKALLEYMKKHEGHVEMSLIVNKKTVDGIDVIQLENAMGSAVHCFEGAIAIEVPRTRFLPVKKTCDLLFLQSDAVSYDPETGILTPLMPAISITLDEKYYKSIDDYESRFPFQFPVSLRKCTSLDINGDFRFGEGVVFEGDVKLTNDSGKQVYIEKQVLSGTLNF